MFANLGAIAAEKMDIAFPPFQEFSLEVLENNGYFFANKFEKFRFEVMSLSKNKQCRIIFEILRYFQDENSGNCFSMSWVRTKDRKTASSSFPKKRLEGEFDMNADF